MIVLIVLAAQALVAASSKKILYMVNMTQEITIQKQSYIKHLPNTTTQGGWESHNVKTQAYPEWYGYIENFNKQRDNSIVLPIRASQVGHQLEHTGENKVRARQLFVEGFFHNPYYGTGLGISWTFWPYESFDKYNYKYDDVDLNSVPLDHICVYNCYIGQRRGARGAG